MQDYYAVLLDTVSIQRYIFSSNRLKDNIGASYLVKNIYNDPLREALKVVFPGHVSDDVLIKWEEETDEVCIKDEPGCQVEIGYIGGGNALLFFREEDRAKQFIKEWSRNLLFKYPGIQTAVALKALPENYFNDPVAFKESNSILFSSLAENKSYYHPSTVIQKHGITTDCRESGNSAEIYKRLSEVESRYISIVAAKKKDAAAEADNEMKDRYSEILGDKYAFTSRLDQLGQTRGESHLAVVHIDGNSMAMRFRATSDLSSYRRLSISVRKATEDAFLDLLSHIINEQITRLKEPQSGFEIARDNDDNKAKTIIPLRHIVLGGDDITFVTDGRLGIYFAEKFIEYFSTKTIDDNKSIAACAGIAIVKTKYPFFRAYELAEELCKNAKKKARLHGAETSWLDFHIAYGGFSGTVEEIREKHFQVGESSLLFGPYCLNGLSVDDESHLDNLKSGMSYFRSSWPRSKQKDLRLALSLGPAACKGMLADLKARGLILPEITAINKYQQEGWGESKTPYFDMVELMEFYPDHCLAATNNQNSGSGEGGI